MSAATRRANKATADDLAAAIPQTYAPLDNNVVFSIQTTSDVCEEERAQIWHLFEQNMHALYRSSSFGWDPQRKMMEIFDPLSRFVVVREGSRVVAYSIFRFEREDRQNVVYCYELQVSTEFRRSGLGRTLTQMLSDIGAQWDMTKVMLTVFKANQTAMSFYQSIGFTTDDTSPDFFGASEDSEYDYVILSRCIR